MATFWFLLSFFRIDSAGIAGGGTVPATCYEYSGIYDVIYPSDPG